MAVVRGDPRGLSGTRTGYVPGAQRDVAGLSANGVVRALPQAGSPLLAQLVAFLQARNPAVVVNEGNAGEYLPSDRDWVRMTAASRPGGERSQARGLLRALMAAGMARQPHAIWGPLRGKVHPPGAGEFPYGIRRPLKAPSSYAYPGDVMWQPPAQVPVNTLPAQVPVATLPEPAPAPAPFAAQTPVGPMFFPPQPTSSLFGSQDPRRY